MKNFAFLFLIVITFSLTIDLSEAGEVKKISPEKARLIILANDNRSFNRPGGSNFIAKNVLIKDLESEESAGYYYKNTEIDFSGLQEVEIFVKTGDQKKQVALSHLDLGGIAMFLREKPQRDCGGFVNFVKYNVGVSRWRGTVDIFIRSSGDVFGLSNNKSCSKIVHYALYLTDNLYLSDYGDRKTLTISTLEQMQDVYPSKYVCILKNPEP